jgi:hypothetical protein
MDLGRFLTFFKKILDSQTKIHTFQIKAIQPKLHDTEYLNARRCRHQRRRRQREK